MYNDGQNGGDRWADDGIYTGTIQAYSNGSIVEFYIWAGETTAPVSDEIAELEALAPKKIELLLEGLIKADLDHGSFLLAA